MPTVVHLLLLPVIAVVCSLRFARTDHLPPNPCPDFFQYLEYNELFTGKLTIPNLSFGTNKVEADFVQRELVVGYKGDLQLFETDILTQVNVAAHRPVTYRVYFPSKNEVPKLTGITVNGNQICAGSTYDPPKQTVHMTHTWTYSDNLSRVSRPPPWEDLPAAWGSTGPPTIELAPTWRTFPQRQPPVPVQAQPQPQPQPQPQQRPVQSQPQPQPQPRPQPRPQSRPRPVQTQPLPLETRLLDEECGIVGEKPQLNPFIVGGSEIKRGEYPWLVAIFKRFQFGTRTQFSCAGSLISARTVITAAHCFHETPPANIFVKVGRHNLNIEDEPNAQTRETQAVISHPNYNVSWVPDADVLLLLLARAVSFTQFVRPICLPPPDFTLSSGYVAGWGGDDTGQHTSEVPKAVDIQIVSNEVCLTSGYLFKESISNRTFCARGAVDTGPCHGDSGSAFAINDHDRWMLRGIVSVGISKRRICDLKKYVLFCDLTKHVSWVRSNML